MFGPEVNDRRTHHEPCNKREQKCATILISNVLSLTSLLMRLLFMMSTSLIRNMNNIPPANTPGTCTDTTAVAAMTAVHGCAKAILNVLAIQRMPQGWFNVLKDFAPVTMWARRTLGGIIGEAKPEPTKKLYVPFRAHFFHCRRCGHDTGRDKF